MVLIRAHFNGLIKKVYLREVKTRKISEDSKETVYEIKVPKRRQRGDHYIQDIWKSNEEIINESFNSILLTLPPPILGKLIAELFKSDNIVPLSLVTLEWQKDIGSVIGDPDIVLCDESEKYIFLIELKIQAKKTNGKFSLQQHTKYSNLIQILESQGKNVKAALLAPSENISDSIVPKEVGWFNFAQNTLIPSIEKIDSKPSFVSNKSVSDYPTYAKYQSVGIEHYGLNITPNKYTKFSYISFPMFRNALTKLAPHLKKPFETIETYSTL